MTVPVSRLHGAAIGGPPIQSRKVNESVVRLGVMQGEYHWHKLLSGRFIIDLEGRSIELLPNQGFTLPKGVLHRTRAPERSVILMVETADTVPTGDT
jgi:hypothetical protein